MHYNSVIVCPCCIKGTGLLGQGSSTLPADTVGTKTFTLSFEMRSLGGNLNAEVIATGGGLAVQFTDDFAFRLLLGAFTARYVMEPFQYDQIRSGYLVVHVVRKGNFLRDWEIYLDGLLLGYDSTGSSDGDVSSIAPLTGSIDMNQGMAGGLRNVHIHAAALDDYSKNTIDLPTVVAAWSLQNDVGLWGLPVTISGAYDQQCPPDQSTVTIDTFPIATNKPVVFPAPYPVLSGLRGYSGCDDVQILAQTIEVNYGQVQFRLKEGNGAVRVRKSCSNGYAEPEEVYVFTTPTQLVLDFNTYDSGAWVLSYDSPTGVYTLKHFGGSAPDFSALACGNCNVPHIPYLYNLLDDADELPFAPRTPPSPVCGDCAADTYQCYLQMGFVGLCVELVTPYQCLSDRVQSIRVPRGTPKIFIGNGGYCLPFVIDSEVEYTLAIRFWNFGQTPRTIYIAGSIAYLEFNTKSEVSRSSYGVIRKIFAQETQVMKVMTDYYSYDMTQLINRAVNADNLQIELNGRFVDFVLEGALEYDHIALAYSQKTKLNFRVSKKVFNIINNF